MPRPVRATPTVAGSQGQMLNRELTGSNAQYE